MRIRLREIRSRRKRAEELLKAKLRVIKAAKAVPAPRPRARRS